MHSDALKDRSFTLVIEAPRGTHAKRNVKTLAKTFSIQGTVQRIVCGGPYRSTGIKIIFEGRNNQDINSFLNGLNFMFREYNLIDFSTGAKHMEPKFRILPSTPDSNDDVHTEGSEKELSWTFVRSILELFRLSDTSESDSSPVSTIINTKRTTPRYVKKVKAKLNRQQIELKIGNIRLKTEDCSGWCFEDIKTLLTTTLSEGGVGLHPNQCKNIEIYGSDFENVVERLKQGCESCSDDLENIDYACMELDNVTSLKSIQRTIVRWIYKTMLKDCPAKYSEELISFNN